MDKFLGWKIDFHRHHPLMYRLTITIYPCPKRSSKRITLRIQLRYYLPSWKQYVPSWPIPVFYPTLACSWSDKGRLSCRLYDRPSGSFLWAGGIFLLLLARWFDDGVLLLEDPHGLSWPCDNTNEYEISVRPYNACTRIDLESASWVTIPGTTIRLPLLRASRLWTTKRRSG
jgi:hypothetical protein